MTARDGRSRPYHKAAPANTEQAEHTITHRAGVDPRDEDHLPRCSAGPLAPIGGGGVTRWRLPTAREIREDRAALSSFLELAVAEMIASLPVVVPDPWIPLDVRVDAWLWRAERLIRECEQARRSPVSDLSEEAA
jgi:hypothetical protein